MAIRIFKCVQCGHKMRFSGVECHNCYGSKQPYQSPIYIVLTAVVLLVALIMAALFSL